MRRVRLAACVTMDTASLVWSLGRSPLADQVELSVLPSHELANALRADEADAALLPAHEALRDAESLELVPGMGIGARGRAGTMLLRFDGRLSDVRRIAATTRGHTAELVARVLFAESGREVEIVDDDATSAADAGPHTARLLVDDDALDATLRGDAGLDLAEAWSDLTNQPIVWRVWAARPGQVTRDDYARLHKARTEGRHALSIALREPARARGLDEEDAAAWIDRRVRYRLGQPQVDGLRALWTSAAARGLLPPPRELRFLPLSAGSACHAKAEALRAMEAARRRSGGLN